jgi:hypothetical protein
MMNSHWTNDFVILEVHLNVISHILPSLSLVCFQEVYSLNLPTFIPCYPQYDAPCIYLTNGTVRSLHFSASCVIGKDHAVLFLAPCIWDHKLLFWNDLTWFESTRERSNDATRHQTSQWTCGLLASHRTNGPSRRRETDARVMLSKWLNRIHNQSQKP